MKRYLIDDNVIDGQVCELIELILWTKRKGNLVTCRLRLIHGEKDNVTVQ